MFTLKQKMQSQNSQVSRAVGRSVQVQAAYDDERARLIKEYGDDVPCPLCPKTKACAVVRQSGTMLVVENDYPYAIYDGLPVVRHYMLVPKRHINSLSDFTDAEQADYWKVYSWFSGQGFNTMTRAKSNSYRSVPGHVHTHLFGF